jgi:hypothetical protein
MVKVIFIDDNYLYQNFPLPTRLERASLLSIIQLEQFTSMQDILGTCLYSDLEQKVYDQSLSSSEEEFFKLVKYSLAMYSAKAAVSLLRTQTAHTKNEERAQDQYVLDTILSTIESKVAYVNKRLVNFIKNDEALYAIATADGCTDDIFTEEDAYQGSVFYPKNGVNENICE